MHSGSVTNPSLITDSGLILTTCRSCGLDILEPRPAIGIVVWSARITGPQEFVCLVDETGNHQPVLPPADREGLEAWLVS